jgi:restriction system protein
MMQRNFVFFQLSDILIAYFDVYCVPKLYSQILSEIRRQTRKGNIPRFVMQRGGLVGLSRWQSIEAGELVSQIEQHNQQARKKIHERLFVMPAKEFEELIGQLIVAVGFEDVIVTNYSGDGGIDVRGTLVVGDVIRVNMAVQVKKWKKGRNVQSPDVQQVRGSLGTHDQGLIITTSDFSQEQPKRPNV